MHSTDANQRANARYVQDQFVADLQNAAGGFAPHGRYVHLYLNGLYWGMYYLHERPDKTFNADYQGGDKDTWNVIKHNSTTIVDNALNNAPGTTASTDFTALLTAAAADSLAERGFDVDELRFQSSAVNDALRKTRLGIHTFDRSDFGRNKDETAGALAGLKKAVDAVWGEYRFRQTGLLVSTVLISIFGVALYLKIRQVDRK